MQRSRPAEQTLRAQRYIEGLVVSGALGPAGRLPSSRSIAATLGVSRTTVNAAIDILVAQGYVTARPRSGLYANPNLRRLHESTAIDAGRTDWAARVVRRPPSPLTVRSGWREARYPLLTGQIEPGLMPRGAWLKAVRAAHSEPHRTWSYSEHSGNDPLLVEEICSAIVASRGIEAEPSQVLITLGSQHGLSLVAQALVAPASVAAIEDPGYPDARAVLGHFGARLAAIPVDRNGCVVSRIPTDARVCYVTPSHQHPSNVTLSVPRRVALIERAARAGMTVIEDDYDSELRYSGAASPALYSLDRGRNTVYLGTFSKFHSPGLRVGFVIADAELIAAMRAMLQVSVRQVPGLLQRALALYIRGGDYARALATYRQRLAERWGLAIDLLRSEIGTRQRFPAGGMSLWVRSAPGVDWAAVRDAAEPRGVLLTPPESHWLDPRAPYRWLRLGFTAADEPTLSAGIQELGAAYREIVVKNR